MKTTLGTIIALATALFAGPTLAQEKTLKVSLYPPSVHPTVKSLEVWGHSLSEASGGTLNVEVYPAEQLGKAVDHYDLARDGIAEMAMAPPGLNPGRFPIMTLSEIPFLMSDVKKGSADFHRWYANYADREMGDVKVCMIMMHDPGVLHTSGKAVRTPSDLAAMKIRPANGTIANFVSSQGATTVQAAMPEIRELVERGVTNGVTFPWNSIFLTKAEGLLTYHLDLDLYTAPNVFVMNKGFYDSLDDTQRAAVDDHCTPEWSSYMITSWADFDAAGKDRFAALDGHMIYSPTEKEIAQWHEAAQPQAERIFAGVKRFGLDGPTLLEELKAELAQ